MHCYFTFIWYQIQFMDKNIYFCFHVWEPHFASEQPHLIDDVFNITATLCLIIKTITISKPFANLSFLRKIIRSFSFQVFGLLENPIGPTCFLIKTLIWCVLFRHHPLVSMFDNNTDPCFLFNISSSLNRNDHDQAVGRAQSPVI